MNGGHTDRRGGLIVISVYHSILLEQISKRKDMKTILKNNVIGEFEIPIAVAFVSSTFPLFAQ